MGWIADNWNEIITLLNALGLFVVGIRRKKS